MDTQQQPNNPISKKEKQSSTKKLAHIRLHVSSEKNSIHIRKLDKNQFKSQYRNSAGKEPKDEKKRQIGKLEQSLKSIREESSTKNIRKNDTELRWKISRTNDNVIRKDALPEIVEFRGERTEWSQKNSFKKSAPSKSMKIQFKELLPIKQMRKEDKIQNLMKIRDQFRELVNTSNNISVKKTEAVFRAYIEKGNNGILVKQIVKKRWWWHLEQKEPTKAHLYWSQWFNKGFTANMPEANFNSTHCEKDYSQKFDKQEPRIQSIRMILDEPTFSRIKPRIIHGDQHYLKCQTAVINKNQIEQVSSEIRQIQTPNMIHNHIDGCLQLHSKKLLFKNLYTFMTRKNWDPFEFMPITYYLEAKDASMLSKIMNHYDQIESTKNQTKSHNMWIVKPGQNSNRGFGISVHAERSQFFGQLQKRQASGKCSLIVQKYLENCFLVYNRKFDIRCYILITTVNGSLKGYWYNDGYIRTSSEEYNLDDVSNRMIHLTNDAVQKHNQSYGKYEDFNKMSFINFKKYISKVGFVGSSFDNSYQKMKKIAYYLIASVSQKIKRKQFTFELFGLDFMLDQKLSPILIEANSNPCLEASGVILGKLIPQLVDNVLMTAIDPLFPPPNKGKGKDYINKDYFQSNKFQLIFADSPSQLSQQLTISTEQVKISHKE